MISYKPNLAKIGNILLNNIKLILSLGTWEQQTELNWEQVTDPKWEEWGA